MSLKQKSLANPTLMWLFTAHFDDGETIVQTQEDKSLTRTDGTGSRFTDVLAKEGLTSFWLKNVHTDETVGVDLKNGNFSINDTVVQLHNQYFEPDNYDLELVYFRETKYEAQQEEGKDELTNPRHYINRYFIGWQTKVQGKNKQVTLAVS